MVGLVADVKAHLDKNKNIKGVLIQGSETSTAVAHPIEEIAKLVKNMDETLLVVDGITALGVTDIPMDEWGIDVLLTGSQKALMLPPGLALIALSEKAWRFCERTKTPGFYFNLKAERKNLKDNTTAYTPAVSLIIGLHKVLEMIFEDGLAKMFADNDRFARATRAGFKALGLKLLAPDSPATSVTGVYLPESVDGGKLVKWLRDDFGVTFAGGQDQLKGKIIRVSHMGYVDSADILIAIGSIEMGLKKFGYNIEMGKGVAAAQEVLLEGY
ncbi:MAG: alanine--glyoxylate aminotransferase family protein [Nitrospinae bacterium]|nr:alanine--glyoxylate aminotransferase family protein [Nitrospinota bacterium]